MVTTFALVLASALAGQVPYASTVTTIKSQGKDVRVYITAPLDEEPRPLIILMHGAGGLAPQGDWMRDDYAGRFAAEGYVVYVPHYRQVPAPGVLRKLEATNAPNFETCLQIFRDLLEYAGTRPNVDPDRIGLLGYSMGASLAVRLAVDDPRVAAVALYSGGHPAMVGSRVDQMPPTILLAGDSDSSAPAKDLQLLYEKLQKAKIPAHLHIYPHMGHAWMPARLDDAAARTATFFENHLGGKASKARLELLTRRAKEKQAADQLRAEAKKSGRPRMVDGGGNGDKPSVLDLLAPDIDVSEDLLAWLEEVDEEDTPSTREVLVEPKIAERPSLPTKGRAGKAGKALPGTVDKAERDRAMKQLGDALVVLKDGAVTATRRGDAFVVRVTRTELRQLAGLTIVKTVRQAPAPADKDSKDEAPRP